MKLTTDANDSTTLSDIIAGHGRDLRQKLDEAQKKPGSAGVREGDRLLTQLMKLRDQAERCGIDLNGDRKIESKRQTQLAELRAEIAKYEGGKQ